jgi:Ca-activated chloride channel family protein
MRADGQPGQAAPAAPAASDKAPRALESAERDHLGRERQDLVARQRDLELREREEYEREFRRRCWIPPQDPRFDMMYFRHTGVNPFVRTEADALSTFGLDVDNASYTVTRAYLDRGQLPPEEAVRVEEFVNFFHQDYPPAGRDDFRIVVDGAPSPCHEGYYLLRVGLRARDVRPEDRKPASITLVIDVSGSMARENRLDLVKRAVRVLLDRLDPTDTVGIVTYTTYAQVALEPTRASRQELIESVLDELQPQQTTNLDQGLEFGYRMAREAYRPGAINRIVLCTDGVANEGITTAEGILDHVRREADAGIHLTAIGVGMGNYNDALLEKLADQGDGNYYYVDSMDEARRVFGERLTGTLQTVAKDAKVQVEFDPDTVSRWRLLGYEKRAIADRDFRNEAVDAGEIGAGHQVTALYEVRLADRIEQRDRDRIRDSGSGREERYVEDRLGVVRLRYREPESEGRAAGIVREQEQRFTMADLAPGFGRASDRLRLDAVVAEFAEILRGSYWARGDDLHDVARIADEVASHLGSDSDVQDFARLVRRAASLKLDREVGDR